MLPAHNQTNEKRSWGRRSKDSFWKRICQLQRTVAHPRLLSLFGQTQIFAIRTAERLWGPRSLPYVLQFFIYCDLIHRLPDYPNFKRKRTVLPSEFWKGITPWRHYLLMIRNWQSTLAIGVLADRLPSPPWAERIQVQGTPPQQHSEWDERPLILVFLHDGGYGILRHWLRAQGLRAATYLTFPAALYSSPRAKKIFAEADRVNGLVKVPHTFEVGGNMRSLLKFLVSGHLLCMALDGQSPSSAVFHANGHSICLSTGIVDLAYLSNAILLPVSISSSATARFTIRFGTSVPQELIDRRNPRPAVHFMLSQLWKNIEDEPQSICWGSLHALAPDFPTPHKPWP